MWRVSGVSCGVGGETCVEPVSSGPVRLRPRIPVWSAGRDDVRGWRIARSGRSANDFASHYGYWVKSRFQAGGRRSACLRRLNGDVSVAAPPVRPEWIAEVVIQVAQFSSRSVRFEIRSEGVALRY